MRPKWVTILLLICLVCKHNWSAFIQSSENKNNCNKEIFVLRRWGMISTDSPLAPIYRRCACMFKAAGRTQVSVYYIVQLLDPVWMYLLAERITILVPAFCCALVSRQFMKSSIFWDMAPCCSLKVNRCFGGKCRLHLQGERISPARKSVKADASRILLLFITIAVRTSDHNRMCCLFLVRI
jgi:hypothetical protein